MLKTSGKAWRESIVRHSGLSTDLRCKLVVSEEQDKDIVEGV
jgi:hypothetical protein